MRWTGSFQGLALMLTSPGSTQGQLAAPAPIKGAEEIVVTARPGSLPPLLDAVGYFQRHCFDASRLVGHPTPPASDPEWRSLDPALRLKFGVTDARATAYGPVAVAHGHTLLLNIERLPLPAIWRAIEERCTIVVVGGQAHRDIVDGFSTMFKGPGTQRHVGVRNG